MVIVRNSLSEGTTRHMLSGSEVQSCLFDLNTCADSNKKKKKNKCGNKKQEKKKLSRIRRKCSILAYSEVQNFETSFFYQNVYRLKETRPRNVKRKKKSFLLMTCWTWALLEIFSHELIYSLTWKNNKYIILYSADGNDMYCLWC